MKVVQANRNFNLITDTLDVDLKVRDSLSFNLNMIVNGRDEVFMTPMAKENTPELLIREFDKVFNSGRSKLNETLLGLEMSNKDKFGPRSIAVPWTERKESLISSFDKKLIYKGDGFTSLRGNNMLRPISKTNAVKLLKNNTNSGLPYYTKKGLIKERVLNKFDILLKRKDPCVLFTRTQEQRKTRNVWGYPVADTLNEMCYYSPLLEYQKKLSYRAALISPDEVSRRVTSLITKAVARNHILQSIDFTSFDTTVNLKLQSSAFDYIKSLFQREYASDIDHISDRFGSIGILTPDGVLSGHHGIPTGSTFTNEVGSIVQSGIALGLDFIKEDCLQVQGDDGVYLLPEDKVNELRERFTDSGPIVNGEKSVLARTYAIYLQNLYHLDYMKDGLIGGIYPIYRALNRIVYQERWSDFEEYGITGKDYYSIRTICIVENCKYHPLFSELVKFVLKYDKYSLSFSDQGLASYVQMISSTKGAGEILKHQYGDDVSGLKSFETVKLLKELS